MRVLLVATCIVTLAVSAPGLRGADNVPREELRLASRGALASPRASRGTYWVREFRRRWQAERRAGQARARTIRQLKRQLSRDPTVRASICAVFGSHCASALRVAWCESRYYTGAQNGQYLGLFQMGRNERHLYGHGGSPLEQAMAAYRYFVASGRDWSPWACKP